MLLKKEKSKMLWHGNIENIVEREVDIDIKFVWNCKYLGLKQRTVGNGDEEMMREAGRKEDCIG